MTLYTAQKPKPAHSPRDGRKPIKLPPEKKHSTGPADPRTHPRTKGPSPHVWTQDSPRTVLQTKPRFASMPPRHRRTQDSSIARTSWEHKLSSHWETCSSRRGRIHVLWCSLEHKSIPDTKVHGQSPLVVRLVVVVHNCVNCDIYLLTLAAHGSDFAIGTFNKPV